jgi:FxsC-like protein
MIADRISPCENEAYELLSTILEAQARDLTTRLNLNTGTIPFGAPAATRNSEIWQLAKQRGGSTLAELDDILRQQRGQTAPLYWLYMSCSEAERSDRLCRRFFTDLTERLQHQFRDRQLRYLDEGNPENPDCWSAWSLRAMHECRVLVCLFSKAFFNSVYCGQVWRAFEQRWLETFQFEAPAQACPLVFPVLWGPPDEYPDVLPRAVQDITVQHATAGTAYTTKGLRFLVQQADAEREPFTGQYKALLDQFAASLLEMASQHPLRTDIDVPELGTIQSAFYRQNEPTATPEGNEIKFIYLAGRQPEMKVVRRRFDAYDDDGKKWRPYHPDSPINIQAFSLEAVLKTGMTYDAITPDERLADNIRAADKRSNITVLLVDPWTIRRSEYCDIAKAYDEIPLSWSIVFLCWNRSDDETQRFRANLESNITRTFQTRYQNRRPDRWCSTETADTLRSELITALTSVKAAIAASAPPQKVATGSFFIRPELVPRHTILPAANLRTAENEAIGFMRLPFVQGPSGGMPA